MGRALDGSLYEAEAMEVLLYGFDQEEFEENFAYQMNKLKEEKKQAQQEKEKLQQEKEQVQQENERLQRELEELKKNNSI